MKKALLFSSVILSSVFLLSASSISGPASTTGPLLQFLQLLQTLVNRLVPFLIGVAVLAFFWYLVTFIWKGAENPKERGEGLKGMGWALIAIFVMVSIWGIIGFISSVTGIQSGGTMGRFNPPGSTRP